MATITKTVTLVPSGYYGLSGMTVNTSGTNAVTNGYTDTSSTTYARFTVNQSTTGLVYYTFDTSSIPANATITSVTAKAKAKVSSTTRVTNTQCQLFSGTTARGSNTTFASTQATTVTLATGTGWTRAYLNDLRIKIGGTGSSSTSSRRIDFYGAEVTITYTVPAYDISITNSTSVSVTASESVVASGDSVDIFADSISGIIITDNGVDVTSQFVQGIGDTVSSVPQSYQTGGSINGTNYHSTIGKGSDTANRTGNDYFSTSQGGSGSTWIDYFFDFSEIPAGATIVSNTLSVKGHCESTSESREISRVQAYAGDTAKGSYTDMTESTTDRVYTVDVGTWTAAELHEAKIRHTIGVYGGLVSGATWTVTYEIEGYVYTITNISANHVIAVSPSGGNPPVITVGTPSRTRISAISNYDQCVCTFTSDLALSQWEARATKAGVTPARGVGLLVESGGALAANTQATIYVENEELTQGDGEYTITVYGQSTDGVWSA